MVSEKSPRKMGQHGCVVWVLIFALLFPLEWYHPAGEPTRLPVIVQAEDTQAAALAVERLGGTVTRQLAVIQAVAAEIPSERLASLRTGLGVSRVWVDAGVDSADTADPGRIIMPQSAAETVPAAFDASRVSACDGNRELVDAIPRTDLNPHSYQAYFFKPVVDPALLPRTIKAHLLFKEKSLNQAQLQIFKRSTNTWQAFRVDPLSSNDANIDQTFDLTGVLTALEDFTDIEMRFLVSRNDGGEKAEVDCIELILDGKPNRIASGGETKPAGIELRRLLTVDSERDTLDYFPVQTTSPYAYQAYTFALPVDPANLPGLVDLNFVFKEKGLSSARLQVFQTSTGIWHTFEIDTSLTEDKLITTLLDLSGVLETPEDFSRVEVRFSAARIAGGEKAEVDLVSIRLAELVGQNSYTDVASVFEAVNVFPVWSRGNTGEGVGVAVLDSGVLRYRELEEDTDAEKNGLEHGWNSLDHRNEGRRDKNGHGTLVASIISNQEQNTQGRYYGVSPDSSIVPVQVLDKEGKGSYSKVIDGIQWVIEHKSEYNIRVLNVSLSAPVRSYYWDDPLNQAVMKAWQAGIVVVVAAGNSGPAPLSIGVPGNNPYVITVGALTDAYTPDDLSDDYIPNFSASGPTYEGFVKPDLIAPGGHIVGLMSDKSELAKDHPQNKIDKDYYSLTGTSMSAGQVSGVAALILAQHPDLTPDQVKFRLLASAVPAVTAAGEPAISIWRQGAGRVDAYAAVYGSYSGEANQGLDLTADLDGTQHFGGFTRWNPDTQQYQLVDADGDLLSDGYTWGGGVAWSEAYTWGGGVAWSEAYTWGGGVAWSEAYTWGGGVAWSESVTWSEASASLVNWVLDE